jgi:hypothetical protein
MLNRFASKFKSHFQSRTTPSFDDIPRLAGGASLVYPSAWLKDEGKHDDIAALEDVFHGLFQRSVTAQPGSVFLVGMKEAEIKARYPMAKELAPAEKIGRVSMTPASVMSFLRSLLGDREMKPYLWDLFYLEQAGNELSKSGPLAMIPDWVEKQLKVETIAAAICGMHRHDATVGAAVRALMKQENFSFALLDQLQHDAEASQGRLSHDVSKALTTWSKHASEVVVSLRQLLDNPPIPLQYLPAVRDAQKGAPGVYYFPDEAIGEIAPVLDAMVLSSGLGDPHHWYIDVAAVGDHHADGLNAISRLGAALWQAREAREAGFGSMIWWSLDGEVPEHGNTKTYQHRCVQGSSFIIGQTNSVMGAAGSTFGIEPDLLDEKLSQKQVGVYRIADQAFRHLSEVQERAARHYSRASGVAA